MIENVKICKTKEGNEEKNLLDVEKKLKKVSKKLDKLEQGSTNKLNITSDSSKSSNDEIISKPEINNEIVEYNSLAEGYNEYCQKFEAKMLKLLRKREEHNIEQANHKAKKDLICKITDRTKNELTMLEENKKQLSKDREKLKKLNVKQIEFEGCTIIVRKNDLTNEREDAIVNPANEYLKHDGGAARCIADKAGEILEKEWKDYIFEKQTLKTGHVLTTNAGNLPCNKVIHAVGPKYNKGGLDNSLAKSQMNNVTQNILKEMIKEKLNSVCIPGISTGIFGFPTQLAAK